MATGASSVRSALEKISVNHLQCSICYERYITPKVLDCQHSFCEECLKKYDDKAGFSGDAMIPCPLCRQETVLPETGIPGLKTNFHLIGLVEEIALQEKVACSDDTKLLCETCEEGNEATRHCLDCSRNICLKCCKTHKTFPTLSGHRVATFEDIRHGKVKVTKQPEEYKCQQHDKAVKQFFCSKCEVLVCHACTVTDHRQPKHGVTGIKEASKEYRQLLTDDFPAFSRDIQFLEESLRSISEATKVFNDRIREARRAVQHRAAEVITQVKAEGKRLLDEINVQEHDHNKRLNEHGETMIEMLQRKKHSLETAKGVANTASDSDFLSLYPVISTDMEQISSQHLPNVAGLQSHPIFLQSQPVEIYLGNVVQEDTWKLYHEFGKQGSGPGEFQGAGGIAAAKPDEIAVADWKNKRVVICDGQGLTKSSIPVMAYDVAAMHSQWVVAHPDFVKVYNKDNRRAYELLTLTLGKLLKTTNLLSVAVKKNGNIIVGDGERKVLTEHSPPDRSLIHTIPLTITPDYLAVMNNDKIVISNCDQGRADIVDVVDGKAATTSTIKPTIRGQLVQHCKGVTSNSSGIYIAMDMGNIKTGHIHHYDSRGLFVSCVAQGLYNPCGITFTADGQQLIVADWHSVKMYHKV